MSVFFTLSGYLITSLALDEIARTSRMAVVAFYARRVRRLLPALLVLLAGIVGVAHLVPVADRTGPQVIGGLTYTSNWVQITRHVSYAELWQGPGVLDHLWSLAIEEQWYVVFPLLVAALVRWRGPARIRRTMAWTFAAVIAVSIVGALLGEDRNVVYLATHTRLGEIAVGGLVALVVPLGRARPARGAQVVGAGALVAIVALFALTTIDSAWLYRGGLPAFAVLGALLVNAAVRVGPVSGLLSWAPLRRLGVISYGLYLYHWPISVVIAAPRVDWPPAALFAGRVVASVTLAELSYRVIESPVRSRTWRAFPTVAAGLGALVAGTALSAAVPLLPEVTPSAVSGEGVDSAIRVLPTATTVGPDQLTGTSDAAGGSAGGPAAPRSGESPARIVVFGDSVADWLLRDGGSPAAAGWSVIDAAVEGCDGARSMPDGRGADGARLAVPSTCRDWTDWYPTAFATDPSSPSGTAPVGPLVRDPRAVAVLLAGQGVVVDRQLEGVWRGPCSEELARWYQADIEGRLDLLARLAGRSVVVLPAWSTDQSRWIYPADHVERVDCVRDILRAAVDSRADVTVVDLAAMVCPSGPDRCRDLRVVDGVHFDREHAPDVLAWLIDRVVT